MNAIDAYDARDDCAADIAAGVQILTDIDNIIYVGKYYARMCEITKTI